MCEYYAPDTSPHSQKKNHKHKMDLWWVVVFLVCICCVFVNPLNLYFLFFNFARGLSTFISYFNLFSFILLDNLANTHSVLKLEQKNIYLYLCKKTQKVFVSLRQIFLPHFLFFIMLSADEKVFFISNPKKKKRERQCNIWRRKENHRKIQKNITILEKHKEYKYS